MPTGPLTCRKCRVGQCLDGDTWCILCSCVQTLSELAKHRCNLPAFRAFGEELVHQTTRQFQAVVTLDRQTNSQFTSLTDRLNNAQRRLNEAEHNERRRLAEAEQPSAGAYPKSAPKRRSASHQQVEIRRR